MLDPRRFAGHGFDVGHHTLGALDRRGVGQLHVQEQVALILLGDEARGCTDELPVGQHQQAAVNEQDHHADAQEAADQASVEHGHPVEEAVEAPEKPAQHGIHGPDEEPPGQSADQGTGDEGGNPDGPGQPAGNRAGIRTGRCLRQAKATGRKVCR